MRRHLILSSASIRLAKLSLCAVLLVTAGCATSWKPRSKTQATIYAETSENPVLWADSTFVDAVDGVAAVKGKEPHATDFGLRSLRGTSCIVEGDTHHALLEKARNYARVYNTELLRRIRGRSPPQSLGASG